MRSCRCFATLGAGAHRQAVPAHAARARKRIVVPASARSTTRGRCPGGPARVPARRAEQAELGPVQPVHHPRDGGVGQVVAHDQPAGPRHAHRLRQHAFPVDRVVQHQPRAHGVERVVGEVQPRAVAHGHARAVSEAREPPPRGRRHGRVDVGQRQADARRAGPAARAPSRRCRRRSPARRDPARRPRPAPTAAPRDGRSRATAPSGRTRPRRWTWRPPQSATFFSEITRSGERRTSSSPGTPLRRPNSSARSCAHVARADPRGPFDQVRRVLLRHRRAADVHERERRRLVVHAQRHAAVPQDVLALHGVRAGVEDDVVTIQHEPDRHHVRVAGRREHGQLAGAGAVAEELPDLVRGHLGGPPLSHRWRSCCARAGGSPSRRRGA